jgi:hypothetical protein
MASRGSEPHGYRVTRRFETPIAVRAYSERARRKPLGARRPRSDIEASPWTLVFDTETRVDAAQQLLVGFFQVRRGEVIEREGAFFDAATITRREASTLRDYCRLNELELMTVAQFRKDVFLKFGYRRHSPIVGFNLPFDISRIAVGHGSARGGMRGGFTFDLTGEADDPRVRVKHISRHAALIDFGIPDQHETPRGWRKHKRRVPPYRGRFVDVKTLASAILSYKSSLQALAVHLDTPSRKHETEGHGKITREYLDYARADVQVTWECFCELKKRYDEHGFQKSADRMLSEASVGKAYLQQMDIEPLLGCVPKFPRTRFGEIFCAYYGGRAEVRNRRVVCEVLYCDFKSMYPTVNSLMGLWRFVIARGMKVQDTTSATQALLDTLTLVDLQRPATWEKLCTLVRLEPQEDILPARAKYDGETYTIGLNYLTTAEPLWYTLADCFVSKLLTGRAPRIQKALTYLPGPPQEGLVSTKILGRDDFAIDPRNDDFFARLVHLRDEAKARRNPAEKALKIIANSTSYGIFIEVDRDDASEAESLDVFGPNGERRQITTKAIEDPGRYFNPLLGVLITGAARLMLGIAEKRTLDLGLDWAFCDTDSLAIVRPKGMPRKTFHKLAQEVINWFTPLSPYPKPGPILRVEDLNRRIGSVRMEPLYCFALSAKRYALFNLDRENRPVLRKASAHGLGHLLDPYPESEAPREIPAPSVPLKEIGVRRWQYDYWYKIVEAALLGDPDNVLFDWHPAFQRPAAIRYGATSPQLLKWVFLWNTGKAYEEQIRPFGFLLAFMPRSGLLAPISETIVDCPKRGRPAKTETLAPIAPHDNDPARALSKVFDRLTGKPVRPEQLKTYAEVLGQYHLSPEHKFANGDHFDRGRTERRHVVATGFTWIGKEANRVGESGEEDPIWSPVEEFVAT